MENQQELGGAQALLQLGSKKSDEAGQQADHDLKPDEDPDAKATNQQINDAVEAAVLRYVGGTLDSEAEPKKGGKKRINPDEIISSISDFQQWTGFLDEGIAENQPEEYYDKPQKKKRKASSQGQDIDPELSGLDSNSEHDQLVRAAILETRELAKQLGSAYNTLSNLPPHQAQQVLAAMQNHSQADAIANIANLAQSNNRDRRPQKSEIDSKNFSHLTSIEALSDEAAKISLEWYNSLPSRETKGPRSFSPEEQRAVEYFFEGYCYLCKTDRQGVCNRIWSNERKKDNFWECFTRVIPYRSRASVYKHVRRQYHIFAVRAKWTAEDDQTLRKLAATKEGNWTEIGQLMGRMPEDCRDRWRNYGKCGENRLQSRWSAEEEKRLKEVVAEHVAQSGSDTVNWTLISEKMDGTRSRIQCRYKWNKLVKRDSLARFSFMDLDTRMWLIQKLNKLGFQAAGSVDWNLIAKMFAEENSSAKWSAADFEYAFEKMKSSIKEHRKLSFPVLVEHLADTFLDKTSRALKAEEEAAAAVVDEPRSPSEYNLWR